MSVAATQARLKGATVTVAATKRNSAISVTCGGGRRQESMSSGGISRKAQTGYVRWQEGHGAERSKQGS